MSAYSLYKEYQKLIAQYDWAVETNLEENEGLSRKTALTIREDLVKAAGKIEL